jgi:hypothetical protein
VKRTTAMAMALGLALVGCNASTGGGTPDQGGTNPPVNEAGQPLPCAKPNACGTCDPFCSGGGVGTTNPFPTDPNADPNLKDSNGVTKAPNGGLTLDASVVNFNYLWLANTYDLGGSDECGVSGKTISAASAARCRGTISKVDTVAMKEVARYFTLVCSTKTGPTGCADVNGKPIVLKHNHTPSRTAVDYNFDVWVANRNVHGGNEASYTGQPSATKIANDPMDCIDRNKNGKIETSADQDGDGHINPDCDGDGQFDTAATKCTNGKPPEFLGDDDECIIFTVNYGQPNDLGRSICLDTGKNNVGASNAWVGTFQRPELGRGNNRFFGIDGNTGKLLTPDGIEMPAGHHTYGCMADAHHIIWATDIGTTGNATGKGNLAFFHTMEPYEVGPLMRGADGPGGSATNYWKDRYQSEYHHYGITINADQHVWLGGWTSGWVLRYKPVRTNFASLSQGTWSRFDVPQAEGQPYTRGIAADIRGKVWVSINTGGYLFRLDQSLPDGVHDLTKATTYYKLAANTVIGSGVDFNGNLWGIGHGNDMASRIDVDAQGNVTSTQSKNVKVGRNPYTYSDFTGYGLMNYVRPAGRWVYQLSGCSGGAVNWSTVVWNATTPTGTAVTLRVRSGDSDTTWGSWTNEFVSSPADISPKSANAVKPNPAKFLQVEFNLKNTTKDAAPILNSYGVGWSCGTVQ